jgi:hypothetical protein
VSVLTPAEILMAARRLVEARPHLAVVAGIVHHEDLWQLCRDELTVVEVRMDGWDIRGRWFGVIVGAMPRIGELRHVETIPWRVIAAQIAPREHRDLHRPDGIRPDRREHRPAALRHDCQLWGFSRVQPIFGGTTEIQKEIIARNLGL